MALDLPNRKIYLLKKKGGKCANTHRPVWGTSPVIQHHSFAPR